MENQHKQHKADMEALIQPLSGPSAPNQSTTNADIETIVKKSIDKRVQSLDDKFDKLLSTFESVLRQSSSSRATSPSSTSSPTTSQEATTKLQRKSHEQTTLRISVKLSPLDSQTMNRHPHHHRNELSQY